MFKKPCIIIIVIEKRIFYYLEILSLIVEHSFKDSQLVVPLHHITYNRNPESAGSYRPWKPPVLTTMPFQKNNKDLAPVPTKKSYIFAKHFSVT